MPTKIALWAGLACGESLRVVSLGCVGARLFEDTTRHDASEEFEVTTGNDVMAASLTPVGAWRELLKK